MPIVDRWTLILLDGVVQTAGVVISIAAAIGLVRSGRWRNPLSDRNQPIGEPDALGIAFVMFGYFMLGALASSGLHAMQIKSEGVGSHAWHLQSTIDSCIRLVAGVAMAVLLARQPLFESPQLDRSQVARLGTLCGLAAVPICMAQLWLILTAWRAIQPDLAEPVHPVIEALSASAWGGWGRLQLAVSAVFVAPLAEELFFRGLLLNFIARAVRRAWLAIVITAIAFGLIHTTQPQDVMPLVSLGLILGYVRVRYNSLAVCVIAHAVFNARTIVLLLLNPEAARDLY